MPQRIIVSFDVPARIMRTAPALCYRAHYVGRTTTP